jgi:dipeptide/tripeptide permease
MKKFLRTLSGIFFGLALLALAWLLLPDLWSSFQPSLRHQQAGALALIFVGASFICLQASAAAHGKTTLKALLLGLAFVLWGGEQFLPPGPLVTALDSAVIAIFVVDLGLVIASQLETPPGSQP